MGEWLTECFPGLLVVLAFLLLGGSVRLVVTQPQARRAMRLDRQRPILSVFLAPFTRLQDLPSWGKGWGVAVAIAQAAYGDMFGGLLILFLASSWADWVFGKRAARVRINPTTGESDFRPELAQLGLYSKAAGFVLVMLVAGAEAWMQAHTAILTKGVISTSLTFAFVVQDMESIDSKRQALGGRPVPFLSRLLVWLRDFPDRFFPTDSTPHPRRRSDDP